MTTAQLRKEKYISNNLCGRCGKRPLISKTLCEECLEDCNSRYRNRRNARTKSGRCVRCGESPLVSDTLCQNCITRTSTYNISRRIGNISNNLCSKCGTRPLKSKNQCEFCLKKENNRNKTIKDKVFSAYGGYLCACCGEKEESFLSIDHINNDGAQHRKETETRTGSNFYRWIVKNNFPSGLQILCMNCQFGKKRYGICPHQSKSKSFASN